MAIRRTSSPSRSTTLGFASSRFAGAKTAASSKSPLSGWRASRVWLTPSPGPLPPELASSRMPGVIGQPSSGSPRTALAVRIAPHDRRVRLTRDRVAAGDAPR